MVASFQNAFHGPWKEGKVLEIHLEDVTPEAFEAFYWHLSIKIRRVSVYNRTIRGAIKIFVLAERFLAKDLAEEALLRIRDYLANDDGQGLNDIRFENAWVSAGHSSTRYILIVHALLKHGENPNRHFVDMLGKHHRFAIDAALTTTHMLRFGGLNVREDISNLQQYKLLVSEIEAAGIPWGGADD